MPRKATKAANNVFYRARLEAASFNDKLSSREGAAEALGVDRTRLARIELGSLNPYPEEVLLMADAYNAPELLNKFCSQHCPIGRCSVPELELLQLDRLTLRILDALNGAGDIGKSLVSIAKDGTITEAQRPRVEEIVSSLEGLSKLAQEMRMWFSKNMPKS